MLCGFPLGHKLQQQRVSDCSHCNPSSSSKKVFQEREAGEGIIMLSRSDNAIH
jgi:hypothetical protein